MEHYFMCLQLPKKKKCVWLVRASKKKSKGEIIVTAKPMILTAILMLILQEPP